MNQANTYLAVESSAFAIHHHLTTEPIVRYDFIRRPKSNVPSAHINVHTVSEALTKAMEDAGRTSAQTGGARTALTVHPCDHPNYTCPLGGHDFAAPRMSSEMLVAGIRKSTVLRIWRLREGEVALARNTQSQGGGGGR